MSKNIDVVAVAWILLIVLKALGYLSWGWFSTIFFPIWFPLAITLLILAGVMLVISTLLLVSFILKLCGIE